MSNPKVHRKRDVHQHVTDHIIAAIEAGAGDWRMPWHRSRTSYGARSRPVNVTSDKDLPGHQHRVPVGRRDGQRLCLADLGHL